MEPATRRTNKRRWGLAPTVMAFVIAALAGGMTATPAQSQENDWNRGHQSQRQHYSRAREHHYRNDYQLRSYDRPSYVYSPPPVYYAPPPGPPVIDFVFPLYFR